MPQLKEFRVNLGLSINRLAELSGLPYTTVQRAEQGKPITAATAKTLADTLSREMGREIRASDIEGLNIR